MNKYILILLISILTFSCNNRRVEYQDKLNNKVDSLMSLMTLEEKIGQLNLVGVGFDVTGPIVSENVDEKIKQGSVGAVFNTFTPIAVRKLQEKAVNESRLGIPLMFGYDVIHGHKTIFPMPIALACSWDMKAIEKMARISAEEASADGLNWVFSPMVDISRDPRWGRIAEGAGEDTWLACKIAKAMVRGYQGEDLSSENTVMACVKHFALYGAAEAGRDYNSTDMSKLKMYQDYLPPYKAALDAGAGSVMTSFNDINGIPATGNKWLFSDLLRDEWKFNGFVVTDYTAINEMVPHGIAANDKEAAILALKAGIDMDMVGEAFLNNLKTAYNEGRITEDDINKGCRKILEAKYKMGLFDNPYKYVNQERADTTIFKQTFLDASREIARKSMVLLKNDHHVLPLHKKGSIALVGPLANNQRDMIGNWSGAGKWKDAISVMQGIKNVVGDNVTINFAHGANISDDEAMLKRLNRHNGNLQLDSRSPQSIINEALEAAKKSDIIVAVVGESQGMTGEAACRTDIRIPACQRTLLKALKKTGKPLILVLMNGRPLALEWESENADAIIEAWFPGSQAGNAVADLLFGNYNPSGKLTTTFPKNVGQIPIYYNHKNTGRPYSGIWHDKYKSRYLDTSNEPLYPFGFGLSYTQFEYSNITLSDTILNEGGHITASIKVKNTGNYDGEEVVQLYIQDVHGSITRPVKELKNYKKVFIAKGKEVELKFIINTEDLAFYQNDLSYSSEAGVFNLLIGTNSRDTKNASFTLKK